MISDEPIVQAIVAATAASIRAEVEKQLDIARKAKRDARANPADAFYESHDAFYTGQIHAYETLLEFLNTQPAYKGG